MTVFVRLASSLKTTTSDVCRSIDPSPFRSSAIVRLVASALVVDVICEIRSPLRDRTLSDVVAEPSVNTDFVVETSMSVKPSPSMSVDTILEEPSAEAAVVEREIRVPSALNRLSVLLVAPSPPIVVTILVSTAPSPLISRFSVMIFRSAEVETTRRDKRLPLPLVTVSVCVLSPTASTIVISELEMSMDPFPSISRAR
ncbi:hypothetical protein D3C71_1248750 [compost metagenome]